MFMMCIILSSYFCARFAEMMPFGHQSSLNHSHFTENYSPTWAALRGDEVTRRWVFNFINPL